jgi:ketosteroid isomerase-like protein
VRKNDNWKAVAFHGTWIGDRPGPLGPMVDTAVPASSVFDPKDDAERAIWAVHRGIEEASATSNAARYRELTSPDFLRVQANGDVRTLDQWVSAFTGTRRPEAVQSNVRIRVYGEIAVMTYLNVATAPDGTHRPPEWMTRLFMRRDGGWKLLYTQSTVARQPAAPQATAPEGFTEARAAMNRALEGGDRNGYAAFLAEDVTWVDRAGRLRNKAAIVAEATAASASCDSAVDLRVYGNAVILIGRRLGEQPGTDIRYLQLWTPEGGHWRMLAHQGTPIGNQDVAPARARLSRTPGVRGPEADVRAVDKVSTEINAGNRAAKSAVFASLTTEQFVAITPTGDVESKTDRIRQIDAATPNPQPLPALGERLTRVHGDVAVTLELSAPDAQGVRTRHTVVSVREGGTSWRRAGIIRTRMR